MLQNIGGIETDGIDINFDLTTAETGIGQFRFQWLTSLLLSYDELFANPEGGFDRVDRKGFELGSPTRGFVETKSTLNTDWSVQDWSARLSLRYLSSLTEQCVRPGGGFRRPASSARTVRQTNELDSVIYTDLQVSWAPAEFFDGDWTFTVGVNNLLNEEPPICFSCDLNSLDGTLYPDRGPVLVPESDLRELAAGLSAAGSASSLARPPQGGLASSVTRDARAPPRRPARHRFATCAARVRKLSTHTRPRCRPSTSHPVSITRPRCVTRSSSSRVAAFCSANVEPGHSR